MDNIRKRHRRAHKISLFLISVVILLIPTFFLAEEKIDYAGSVSCKQCHERFYNLWSASHHGKAMQPFTPEFAAENLTLQENDIAIYAEQNIIENQSIVPANANGMIKNILRGKNQNSHNLPPISIFSTIIHIHCSIIPVNEKKHRPI